MQRAHIARPDAEQHLRLAGLHEHDALLHADRDALDAAEIPAGAHAAALQPAQHPAGREDQRDDDREAEADAQETAGIDFGRRRRRRRECGRRSQREETGKESHVPSPQRSLRTRSAGLMTSVRRIPNLSLTTTTSPCATSVPLTNTSSGSPAARSSSTTEPWFSAIRLRIEMRVRPTSIASVTGTSRITSRLTSPPVAAGSARTSSKRTLATS